MTESTDLRIRVIRELLAEADTETPHTTEDAMSRQGAIAFLQKKLSEAGRVMINGD